MRGISIVMIALALLLLDFSLFIPQSTAYVAEGEPDELASVTISPSFLNTYHGSPVMGELIIRSDSPSTYEINITGVPERWLGYSSSVHVESQESVMYIINPQGSGDFILSIEVMSESGSFFHLNQRLWVGRSQANPNAGGADSEEDSISGGLTGMFSYTDQDVATLISAVVVIAGIITVFLGYGFFKEDIYPATLAD